MSRRRPRTTDFVALDVRPLLRAASGCGPLATRASSGWFSVGAVVLAVTFGGAKARIAIATTPQPFGGVRRWASCPACLGRCAVLYLEAGAWRCRRCISACYPSTRESQRDRALRRARRACARLGVTHLLEPLERPARMHKRRFAHLARRAEEARAAVIGATIERLKRHVDETKSQLERRSKR